MVNIKKQIVSDYVIDNRSYGFGNPCNYITVHQTGNTDTGADAQAHANIQTNFNPRQASWHYSVDDKEAIQSFPDEVQCWAATDGCGPGNTESIHIEICINSNGDYVKAVENAAELVKLLKGKHNADIKQHHDWYDKDCPRQLRAGHKGITWNDFLNMVDGNKTISTPDIQVESHEISKIGIVQDTLNERYGLNVAVDGLFGKETKWALTVAYQTELNKQFGFNLVIDGVWGPKTKSACMTVPYGSRGNITWIVQAILYCYGYNPKGLDKIFGNGTFEGVKEFQEDHDLYVDGLPGKASFSAMLG